MLLSCDTQYAPNLILQYGYDYDFLGQLISADYANATISDESYTYDSNGNRITANGDNYTTSTNNELTSDGAWSYTYDDEGNRISKTNSTNRELYEWDYRNRLTSVTQQEFNAETQEWTTVQIVEYTYDYNNVWIRKINGSDKTIFIPENYQTTVQIDNGAVSHHYLWTPNTQDKLLADVTSTDILWSFTDHLGTIRDVVGNSTTHLIYDAFGNLISGTTPILFGYTGKAFDVSTQLQNNINRWYDSTVGRWLSPDPIGFEGNDTNLYRYVGNNTIVYIDLYGLEDNSQACEFLIFIGDNAFMWNLMKKNELLTTRKPSKSIFGDYPDPQTKHWCVPDGTFVDGHFCWSGDFFENLPNRDFVLIRNWETLPRAGVGDIDNGMVRYDKITEYLSYILPVAKERANALHENGCCNEVILKVKCSLDAKRKINIKIKELEKQANKITNKMVAKNTSENEKWDLFLKNMELFVIITQWKDAQNFCEGKEIIL